MIWHQSPQNWVGKITFLFFLKKTVLVIEALWNPAGSYTAVGIGGAGSLVFRFLKLISCSHHPCLTWPIPDGEDSGLLARDTACPPLRACQHFQSGPWWAGEWAEVALTASDSILPRLSLSRVLSPRKFQAKHWTCSLWVLLWFSLSWLAHESITLLHHLTFSVIILSWSL